MNEETEILLGQAALGQLSPEDEARWEELCREDPKLLGELESMREAAIVLSGLVAPPFEPVEQDLPDELPAPLLAKLKAGRKEVFAEELDSRRETLVSAHAGQDAEAKGAWARFSNWLEEVTSIPAPALAGAVAALLLVATGWWIWQGSDSGNGPIVAMVKDPAISPDLLILSPGKETAFVDPGLAWLSFNPQPAEVTILTADGKNVLFTVSGAVGKATWQQVVPTDETASLASGKTYLLRVRQGDTISERLLRVLADARPVASWMGDPAVGKQQAREWLDAGRPGDALILAAALAGTFKEQANDFTGLRAEAQQAAMAEARAEVESANTSSDAEKP